MKINKIVSIYCFQRATRLSESKALISRKIVIMLSIFYFVLSTFYLSAQLATLDSKRIYASLPALAKADTLVAEKQVELNGQYSRALASFEAEYRLVDSIAKQKPKEASTQQMIQTLKKKELSLRDLQQSLNQKLEEYKQFIYKPYNDQVSKAIKSVALRLKYGQVMDLQQVPLLYIDPAKDITLEVIKELKQ